MITTANRTTHASTGILDRQALLERVGGDDGLLREITKIFLEEYPTLLDEIRSAVAAGDAQRIERAAHSLKGAVANFGAAAATDAAYQMESVGRRGQIEQAPSALISLEFQFQLLRPALLELIG
jgi:two-component system sensor histidine kinase/response regulator